MDFARRQQTAGRKFASIAIVVALHLALGWALVSGMAFRIVKLIPQAPIEIRLIKPETPPPPQPQRISLPMPSLAPPPPRFIPPPEVQVTQPPETTVTASPVPQTAPGTGNETATPQQGRGQSGTGSARTAAQLDFSKCGTPPYPDINVQGTTMIVFTMDTAGAISEARVDESSGPSRRHKVLDRLAVNFVLSCKGTPGTVNGKPVPLRGIMPVTWNLKD